MINSNAKWIWICDNPQPEEYGCFIQPFFLGKNYGKVIVKIAAETDYIMYVNGTVSAFSQFPGYPFEKYYDEIDITRFCKHGENEFSVTVRYEGAKSGSTHIEDGAGVIFCIEADNEIVAFSSKDTLCGFDGRYVQHEVRSITPQLGYSSGMKVGKPVFDKKAVQTNHTYNLVRTPVKKTQFAGFQPAKSLGNNLYDLGRETAGYLYIKIKADHAQKFIVSYGEHISDGCVRRIIENRDFSLDFHTEKGEHEFTQYFVRVACRYLQVDASDDVEILEIGVCQYLYPVTEKPFVVPDQDKKIYETCVRTLRLCMNHHYEDCPWREQALYILDSRNQMLCGYYAFNESDFQRENILFMSKGTRDDGFFELTFPSADTPSIPFFSIMYPVMVAEYIEHTGDKRILDDVMGKIVTVMKKTKERIDDRGLIPAFEEPYWNFYEWADGSDGCDEKYFASDNEGKYHLILNCAFVYAGTSYHKLCDLAGVECDIDFESLKKEIHKNFFDCKTGLFANTLRKDKYSQLGNAFAVLIGLGDERTLDAIKESDTLVPATLSMSSFIYDALLNTNYDDGKDYILKDIRKKYNYMLQCGASSFWETILGHEDFNGAGSLCHGWSALPVYYYNKLL